MIGKKIQIKGNIDERGMLMAVNHIPFDAKRLFFISDVPEGAERGNHFSKTSGFLYVVVKGGCRVQLDNGTTVESYDLKMSDGLLFPKKTWMKIDGFHKDTILCVLADTEYNALDYVSDYKEFMRIVREEYV